MNKRLVSLGALLAVAAIAGWLAIGHGPSPGMAQTASVGAASSKTAIPVMAEEARRADVPVYLIGLGTVQAFNSVLVKSRVDGQIVKINFIEGQEVHAGDILAEIDAQPFQAALALAQATKQKDQAQLDNARLDLTRANRLVVTGTGTTQQQDTSRALVAQLEGGIKADQAMIDTAQIQLNYTRIRSPIDGRTGARLVDAGNIVHAGDTAGIVTINQIHPIFVSFALPSATLPEIRTQMRAGDVEVTVEDGGGHALASGNLTLIDNQINAGTATIAYKATFANADEALWPGQFVNVRLKLQVKRGVVTVPLTAVVRGPDGPYAFVIGADRVAEKRPLTVGFTNKDIAVIDHGLAPGEQVVTDGQSRLEAGNVVDILPAPSPSPGNPVAGG